MTKVKASPRAELAKRIADYLTTSNIFTAPYGVIEGLYTPESKRGKARVITFGFAGTMDATLFVWSDKCLELKTTREDAKFKTEQEFYDFAHERWGAPKIVTK